MEGLRVPSKNNMSNIRDLFARDHREKVPPDLRYALNFLQLDGFEDLEERFLSTDAFLQPWSVFRDFIFLLFPDAMPRATQLRGATGTGISRLDILWYYTQFDEGTLRYDPRADKYSEDYTPDRSVYGLIDKSKWRVEDYEKHLYSWLLQEFKVGKAYSPWRFVGFELKSICTVWEEIFVPIVNAVRSSYDPKGRRHYGRLALYVEARCPSRLAFPDSNVSVSGPTSSTPFHVVSLPKQTLDRQDASPHQHPGGSHGILSRKHYDATERELRDVYPQYGGLVERPKFKHRMDEWLAEQRARADRRKKTENHGQVQVHQPQIIQQSSSRSPPTQFQAAHRRSISARGGGGSPIKRCSDSIRRSLSGFGTQDQKSPLHGVTRQLHLSDYTSSRDDDFLRNSMVITPLSRPVMCQQDSTMSVYASVRNSNPFVEELQDERKPVQQGLGTTKSLTAVSDQSMEAASLSPMGQLSAIPPPLRCESGGLQKSEPEVIRNTEVRFPSYEGTAYEKEISLTDLHTRRMMKTAYAPSEQTRAKMPVTRLPAPIVPIPYGGPRVASADTPTQSHPKPVATNSLQSPLRSIAWPGAPISKAKTPYWSSQSPPKNTAWPGFDSDEEGDITRHIPSKSPERYIQNPRSRQLMREVTEREVTRIVSKENIHAALQGLSRVSLIEEDFVHSKPVTAPSRTTMPMKHQLQTYNTHLFPRNEERKGTPVGGWVKGEAEKAKYEMEVLKNGMG
jgi:hypothetical protein